MQLRDYQNDIAGRAAEMLRLRGVCYLSMQVRTGKTFTAMHACSLYGAKRVLFVSKLKALGSIKMDYQVMQGAGAGYSIEFANWESLHKVTHPADGWDVVILDEAHGMGQYPKPAQRVLAVRRIQSRAWLLLSGTPSPETSVQLFHQFHAIRRGPWMDYPNFYKWFADYGDKWQKYINGFQVNQYNRAKDNARVLADVAPYMITWTQVEAGFKAEVQERIVKLPMPAAIAWGIRGIRKDGLLRTREGLTVIADTPVKELGKVHQLCGGTIIYGEEKAEGVIVADVSKAKWIEREYGARRVAVFYKYKGELQALDQVLGKGCETPEAFNAAQGAARIYLQIASGREGVNVSTADALVMYNIDFAAVSYWQARARIQTFDRSEPALVVWLMFDGGIEEKIYAAVMEKKDYTLQHYRRDLFS